MEKRLLFQEVQKFPLWLRLVIVAGILPMVSVCWFVLTETASEHAPGGAFIIFFCLVFMVILPVAIAALFLMLKLETQVRRDGLYVRFFPIHIRYRKFEREVLFEYFSTTYSPIREYGGWGIRFGAKGKAYNVSGSQGVQLVFKDGKRLLIGSQQPDKLGEAMELMD
jgi:hypothetical protein